MDKEEITHLERMIYLHKKNLYTLEEMLAKYGADQPLHLINSVTMEREAILRYSKQIGVLDLHKPGTGKNYGAGKPAAPALFCRPGGGAQDHFRVPESEQQNVHYWHRGDRRRGKVGAGDRGEPSLCGKGIFRIGHLDLVQGSHANIAWHRAGHS